MLEQLLNEARKWPGLAREADVRDVEAAHNDTVLAFGRYKAWAYSQVPAQYLDWALNEWNFGQLQRRSGEAGSQENQGLEGEGSWTPRRRTRRTRQPPRHRRSQCCLRSPRFWCSLRRALCTAAGTRQSTVMHLAPASLSSPPGPWLRQSRPPVPGSLCERFAATSFTRSLLFCMSCLSRHTSSQPAPLPGCLHLDAFALAPCA